MRQYIGTKLIEAEPAARVNGKEIRSVNDIFDADDVVEAGYLVQYADGYESWSPKAVFEAAYLPLDTNQKLKTDKPSISAKMVEDFIVSKEIMTLGDKNTVVRVVLRNGFEIVEYSACVSPENYDEALGAEICIKKIKEKVWMLLGFLLQTAVSGI